MIINKFEYLSFIRLSQLDFISFSSPLMLSLSNSSTLTCKTLLNSNNIEVSGMLFPVSHS